MRKYNECSLKYNICADKKNFKDSWSLIFHQYEWRNYYVVVGLVLLLLLKRVREAGFGVRILQGNITVIV